MLVFGGTPMRSLKTLLVLLAFAGAVPHVRCVCPDGRIKLFCLGISTSSSCCCISSPKSSTDPSASSSSPMAMSDDRKVTCCGHPRLGDVLPNAESASLQAPCGCQQSLSAVAEAALTSAADALDTLVDQAFAPMAWTTHPVVSGNAYYPGRASPRFLLPPVDLVIKFCHFTC
jgi:hypothetical protein